MGIKRYHKMMMDCFLRVEGDLMPCAADGQLQDGARAVVVWKNDVHPTIAARWTVVNMGVDFNDVQYIQMMVRDDEIIWPIKVKAAWDRWSLARKSGLWREWSHIVHDDMWLVYPTLYMRAFGKAHKS